MAAAASSHRHPARVAARLVALALLLAWGAVGCSSDSEEAADETEGDVMVSIRFDEVAYVDAAMSVPNLVDRIRHQTRSVFLALRKAGITVSPRRQVGVDPNSLRRERVTVVDPGSGITRSALRLLYHFESLAIAPRSALKKAEVQLGVLHTLDDSKLRHIRPLCASGADAKAPLWSVFDSSLPGCALAVTAEAEEIDAARSVLTDPAHEIVSIEFERRYLPVKITVEPRRARAVEPAFDDAGDLLIPAEEWAKVPGVDPGTEMSIEDIKEGLVMWAVDDERDKLLREAEKEEFESVKIPKVKMRSGAYQNNPDAPVYSGGGPGRPPNYTLLYVAAAAGVVFLIMNRRLRDKNK